MDADRAPDHWFPRDCPRAVAWVSCPPPPGPIRPRRGGDRKR
ncbi:hypothetical protein [Streptomyces sp. NPDC127098]